MSIERQHSSGQRKGTVGRTNPTVNLCKSHSPKAMKIPKTSHAMGCRGASGLLSLRRLWRVDVVQQADGPALGFWRLRLAAAQYHVKHSAPPINTNATRLRLDPRVTGVSKIENIRHSSFAESLENRIWTRNDIMSPATLLGSISRAVRGCQCP